MLINEFTNDKSNACNTCQYAIAVLALHTCEPLTPSKWGRAPSWTKHTVDIIKRYFEEYKTQINNSSAEIGQLTMGE